MKINIVENIKTETEKIFCDICFEEIPSHRYICSVCERDICYSCFGKPREIEGIGVMPCPICRKIKKYIPKIKHAWKSSDYYRELAFKYQVEWGKDSRSSE